MVLLHAVARKKIPATVLHMNHNLRGQESDLDEAFVREASAKLGLPFVSEKLDWSLERPSQNLCREKRLAFFRRQAGETGKVLLAHHLDDQAETVFLRILRGTGVRGLRGMLPVNGPFVRPLLSFSKEELRQQAEAWGVQWREDSSNLSSKYERNWLRLEILPLLEKRRPGINHRLAALAQDALLASPKERVERFSHEGASFYRLQELRQLSDAALCEEFSLLRSHTKAVRFLLEKGQGSFSRKNCDLQVSGGVVAKGFQAKPPKQSATQIVTEIGAWQFSSAKALSLRDDLSVSTKRVFQEAKVPLFFRNQIPLGETMGKLFLPLPGRDSSIQVELSSLGKWWLTPS